MLSVAMLNIVAPIGVCLYYKKFVPVILDVS